MSVLRAVVAGLLGLAAVALVSACSPTDDQPSPGSSETPSGTESLPPAAQSVVLQQDFQIAYELEGITVASTEVPVPTGTGLRWEVLPADGTRVGHGDVLGSQVVDPDYLADLTASAVSSRIDAARLAALPPGAVDVVAPIAGVGRVREESLVVEASGYDVVVPITGIQHLRMSSLDLSATAHVETVTGRRTVPCQALWTTERAEGDSGAELRCRLPRTVETAGDLRAFLSVASATIDDAILVPEIMLGYDSDGYTVTIRVNGSEETIPVDVGPGDGVLRVVLTALPVGAELVRPSSP